MDNPFADSVTDSTPKRARGRPRKTLDERDDGNRRQALLSAAARLFRRQGFDGTSTRDIATAAGMHSAIERQAQALQGKAPAADAADAMRRLIKAHFDVLLGPGNDFVPVMLYEHRALSAAERATLAELQVRYEAVWTPVLQALHDNGQLQAPVKLSRLLILGALNWTVQWFDRKKGASVDELTDAAMRLFLRPPTDC